jgi:hypothetical protein
MALMISSRVTEATPSNCERITWYQTVLWASCFFEPVCCEIAPTKATVVFEPPTNAQVGRDDGKVTGKRSFNVTEYGMRSG